MAKKKFKGAYGLTGGAVGDLDSEPVANLADLDAFFVQTDGVYYPYSFDASATDAESSPMYIRPDDYAAAGVHVLQSLGINNIYTQDTTSSTTGVIYKGADRFIHNFNIATTNGRNTFIGVGAGNFTLTGSTTGSQGSDNTMVGDGAGRSLTVGTGNLGVGANAIKNLTAGGNNVGIGNSAGGKINTGGSNVAVGNSTLGQCTTASNNMALGHGALNNTTGGLNTGLGANSLNGNTTGTYNSAIGYLAGRYVGASPSTTANATSDYCTMLGADTRVNADGDQNSIAIGYQATGKGTDTAIIGAEGTNTRVYATGGLTVNDEGLDVDTQIKGSTDDNLLYVDAGNDRVGIGTGTPSFKLHLLQADTGGGGSMESSGILLENSNATAGEPVIAFKNSSTGSNMWMEGLNQSDVFSIAYGTIFNNASTFVSVDTSGNVGIGTIAPIGLFTVQGSGGSQASFISTAPSGTNAGAGMIGYSNDGAAMGSGDRLGFLVFGGAEDTADTLHNATGIFSFTEEAWNASANGANLIFETTAIGGTSRSERVRIGADGNVGIGETSPVCDLDVDGGLAMATVAKTGAYTTTVNDHTITCGAGNETFTVTLIAAASAAGQILNIKNVGTGTITIAGDSGTDTIDGATTQTLTAQYECLTIQSDATDWWII